MIDETASANWPGAYLRYMMNRKREMRVRL